MRLIGSCACLAALLVLSASEASAQSRGTITVTVRVVRGNTPQTQTQTQTQLTEKDGTSSQPVIDAAGQPVTDASGQPVTTGANAVGDISNAPALAAGDVAPPAAGPSATPLNRFRVLTINY